MAETKSYLSFTGLTDFYYGKLDGLKIAGEAAERVKYLQEITVGTEQELVKAFGDDTIAEMAVATGSTSLTTQFHAIPVEDRAAIYGWIEDGEMYALPGSPNPPYVACMFSKTKEDGSREHIGFSKGKFTISDSTGQTKGDTVEFSNDPTEGEFMAREVEGFDEPVTYIVVSDLAGETTNRDALYEKIFGVVFPIGAA